MVSEEQQSRSTFIKDVHKALRIDAKSLGAETAWRNHLQKQETLVEYAKVMQNLARHWQANQEKDNCLDNCRIRWTHTFCTEYFRNDGILYQRRREKTISSANRLGVADRAESTENHWKQSKLKLLDVGSCYNPFRAYDDYDVLAVDIAPALDSVYKCDFLELDVREKSCEDDFRQDGPFKSLPCQSFHIVVFSLLLEYLPSPEQRLQCCKTAYSLLNDEGVLLILTPDSKHVGANVKYMKAWRYVLATIGFSRIRYEKLKYLHCMAFRKSIIPDVAKRWADIMVDKVPLKEMYIPQDFSSN